MDTQDDITLYGIDWNGPIPTTEDDQVEVASTDIPLQEQDYIQLQSTISPLTESECQGVDLYIQTLEFVQQKLDY